MKGTDSGLCPMAGFNVSGTEPSRSVTTVCVTYSCLVS